MPNSNGRGSGWLLPASLSIAATLSCQEQAPQQGTAPARDLVPVHNAALAASATSVAAAQAAAGADPSAALDVTFTLQDGFQLSLAALKGKFVAVFFCPSARSPDCVAEAHALRDHWNELHEQHLVAVVGVTRESPTEQRAFITEHGLPLDLASDPDGQLAQSFGLPARGDYRLRTFLIARDGKIRKSWQTGDAEAHMRELLALAGE